MESGSGSSSIAVQSALMATVFAIGLAVLIAILVITIINIIHLSGEEEGSHGGTDPESPIFREGYGLMQIRNVSGRPDSEVNVLLFGELVTSGGQRYLKATNEQGYVALIPEETLDNTTLSTTYSYSLTTFPFYYQTPEDKTNDILTRFFYVSPMISVRCYVSIKYQMFLAVDVSDPSNGKIIDPSPFNIHDPNYFTVYDKVEYSLTNPVEYPAADLYINPTAVDFFSIPLSIHMANKSPGVDSLDNSGLTSPRSVILNGCKHVFDSTASNLHNTKAQWDRLFLDFNGTLTGQPNMILRLVSPSLATAPNASGANPNHTFDNSYLTSSTYGVNFTNATWLFYKIGSPHNKLQIDATELNPTSDYPDNYLYLGLSVEIPGIPPTFPFIFENFNNSITINMNEPTTSNPYFAGAGLLSNEANGTPNAIIVRQFTAAFSVGFLGEYSFPTSATSEQPSFEFMDLAFFKAHKSEFYTRTWTDIDGNVLGPFYDLYAKALHSFGDPIYAFAYDDALGQDGTLTGNTQQNPNGGFSTPTITINGVDTTIPDVYNDSTEYTVHFSMADNNPVEYNNGNGWIAASDSDPIYGVVSNNTQQFQIRLLQTIGGDLNVLTIYLAYGVIIPELPTFAVSSGVQILHIDSSTVTITTPAAATP